MKSKLLLVALVLFSTSVAAQEEPQPQNPWLLGVFTSEMELNSWCEQEARKRYAAKNITAYNWTSSPYNSSNVLYVRGKLRANGKDVSVRCQVGSGASATSATIEIDDPSLH